MIKILFIFLICSHSLVACKSSDSDMTWISDALISESTIPSFNIVKGDHCFPKPIITNKNITDADIKIINEVIIEINNIAKYEYTKLTTEKNINPATDCKPTPIFINISEYQHKYSKEHFMSKYRLVLGEDDFEYAIQQGLSTKDELGSGTVAPCFAHGVYSSIEVNKADNGYQFMRSTNPKFWFIQIGYRGTMIDREFKHCLQEEMAHALFSIPDRLQNKNNETIFNIPSKHQSPEKFTNKDRQLMHFIANNPEIIGMSKLKLYDYIKINEKSSEK